MKIYISITNCNVERSFFSLKRIKNYLCSKLEQLVLNSLAIWSVKSEMTYEIKFEDMIQIITEKKNKTQTN